jgi:DNA-binding LytR/AlgR family response regulator
MESLKNGMAKNKAIYLANNNIYQAQENFIIIKDNLGYHKVFLKNILYCESDNSYITLFLSNSKQIITSEFTMKECETFLTHSMGFVRVHNRHIINVVKMNIYFRTGDGGTIQMENSDELKIARNRRAIFLKVFNRLAIN